jgi:hypothetical protein
MLTLKQFALAATTTLTTVASTAVFSPTASANPFTGTSDGWTYIQDAAYDSTGGRNKFEIFGMAYQQVGNSLMFSINANLGVNGVYWGAAANDNINFGDMILDFGSTQYGVRFAQDNDSGVSEYGLYADITTKDVTATNQGWETQKKYSNNAKGERFYGDSRDAAYFSNTDKRKAETVIASGTKVADDGFRYLSASELLDFGAAFNTTNIGSQTFGFAFNLTEDMVGAFDAKLLLECINDGLAITGDLADVPEPASVLGLFAIAGLAGARLRRRAA